MVDEAASESASGRPVSTELVEAERITEIVEEAQAVAEGGGDDGHKAYGVCSLLGLPTEFMVEVSGVEDWLLRADVAADDSHATCTWWANILDGDSRVDPDGDGLALLASVTVDDIPEGDRSMLLDPLTGSVIRLGTGEQVVWFAPQSQPEEPASLMILFNDEVTKGVWVETGAYTDDYDEVGAIVMRQVLDAIG